jgi:hypothetical protein
MGVRISWLIVARKSDLARVASSAIGYRLSAIGYRLSAIGYRLSAIGYRLSAIGYLPLNPPHQPLRRTTHRRINSTVKA